MHENGGTTKKSDAAVGVERLRGFGWMRAHQVVGDQVVPRSGDPRTEWIEAGFQSGCFEKQRQDPKHGCGLPERGLQPGDDGTHFLHQRQKIVHWTNDARIFCEFQDGSARRGDDFEPFHHLWLHADQRRVRLAECPLEILPCALDVSPRRFVGASAIDWWRRVEVEVHRQEIVDGLDKFGYGIV